jgi:hypothetical protein
VGVLNSVGRAVQYMSGRMKVSPTFAQLYLQRGLKYNTFIHSLYVKLSVKFHGTDPRMVPSFKLPPKFFIFITVLPFATHP